MCVCMCACVHVCACVCMCGVRMCACVHVCVCSVQQGIRRQGEGLSVPWSRRAAAAALRQSGRPEGAIRRVLDEPHSLVRPVVGTACLHGGGQGTVCVFECKHCCDSVVATGDRTSDAPGTRAFLAVSGLFVCVSDCPPGTGAGLPHTRPSTTRSSFRERCWWPWTAR